MHLEYEVGMERIVGWVTEQVGEHSSGGLRCSRELLKELLFALAQRWKTMMRGAEMPLNALSPAQRSAAQTLIHGLFGVEFIDAVLGLHSRR